MNLKGDFPTILLPVETTTRELDSKLIMASALAAQGCRIILGQADILKKIAWNTQQVLWHGKELFYSTASKCFADDLVERGSAIIYLHDEGGLYEVKPWVEQLLRLYPLDQLGKLNRVCVWGEKQKEVLLSRARGELTSKIKVTGSPRFDICRPSFSWITKQKTDAIRSRYSPLILICTRFANAVHTEGPADVFYRQLSPFYFKEDINPELVDRIFSIWQREMSDLMAMVFLVKEFAINYPQYTIIVRPHPSESISFYETAFAFFKNVVVTREDSVLAWIRAAELVVHSNCTTGVEAVLAGRPVLNFIPTCSARSEFDKEVAREAGTLAKSIDEALNKTGELLAGDSPQHAWSPHAQTILHNLNHETIPSLVAETLNVIKELHLTTSRIELPKRKRHSFREVARTYLRSKFGEAALPYWRIKWSPLDPAHVSMILEECKSNHIGSGAIRHLTADYVVVDPT